MSAQSCTGNDNFRTEVETEYQVLKFQVKHKLKKKSTGTMDKLHLLRLDREGPLYHGVENKK